MVADIQTYSYGMRQKRVRSYQIRARQRLIAAGIEPELANKAYEIWQRGAKWKRDRIILQEIDAQLKDLSDATK